MAIVTPQIPQNCPVFFVSKANKNVVTTKAVCERRFLCTEPEFTLVQFINESRFSEYLRREFEF
jgi:hypothetical protein